MKIENNLTLIDGVFTPSEAREVLLNVYGSKIRFHKAKNFSSKERDGIEDEVAIKRIALLNKAIETIDSMLLESLQQDELLVIKSEILITSVAKKDA